MGTWYALRSKPNSEEVLYRLVATRGFEVYYPRLAVKPVNPRAAKFKPFFPGYMFINVDLDDVGLSTFQWMPHSLGLVSFGSDPAIIPDDLFNRLRKELDARIVKFRKQRKLTSGDSVLVNDGLFKGYRGIFDVHVSGEQRVRVLLKLLDGHQRLVVLPADSVERKAKVDNQA